MVDCVEGSIAGSWIARIANAGANVQTPPGAGMHRSPHRVYAAVAVAARLAPDARKRVVAIGAEAIFADAVLCDEEAAAFDHRRAAVVAARVLPFAYAAGDVAGVEVFDAGALAV